MFLSNSASSNAVGGSTAGAGNVIAGNAGFGILVQSGGNVVQGNVIGLDAAGNLARPNGQDGIRVNSSAGTLIGGVVPATRNIISGNAAAGITLFGAATTNTLIQGNYIGTRADGAAAVGNARAGISLESGADGNTIGGTAAGAGNVVSGNTNAGIQLVGISNTLGTGQPNRHRPAVDDGGSEYRERSRNQRRDDQHNRRGCGFGAKHHFR